MNHPTFYHQPVLLAESIHWLNIQRGGSYVDVTFGGGGHSRAILGQLGPNGRLYAVDQDPDAQRNIPADPRFTLLAGNFRHLSALLYSQHVFQVDGILADLGVSSHQFDEPSRGFSFRADAPLDMRMGPDTGLTAADILNDYSAEDLARILREYGEVPQPMRMARALAQYRPLQTTGQLVEALQPFLPRHKPREANSLLAQVFQALRIEVNDEIGALLDLLAQALELLKPGGRLVVISYHSLEDRPVKHFLNSGHFDGVVRKDMYGNPLTPWQVLTRKPLTPTDSEIAANPRARSAKLRVAEKKLVPPTPSHPPA